MRARLGWVWGCGRRRGAPAANWVPPPHRAAVKNAHGEYYLNGHWTIEGARALPAASTILHYERGAEGDLAPERLHARGPTSEPLVIEVSGPGGRHPLGGLGIPGPRGP